MVWSVVYEDLIRLKQFSYYIQYIDRIIETFVHSEST